MLKRRLQYFGHLMGRLAGKDPAAGKDQGQKEKWVAEAEMLRQRHRLDGRESEQTLGNREAQGSLERCGPWGHKELATT